MQNDEALTKLEDLRKRILSDVSGMADQLADSDTVDYDALLSIARTTGRSEFLDKALARCEQMEDADEKMQSLLDLLDTVDVQIGLMRYDENADEPTAAPAPSNDQAQPTSSDQN